MILGRQGKHEKVQKVNNKDIHMYIILMYMYILYIHISFSSMYQLLVLVNTHFPKLWGAKVISWAKCLGGCNSKPPKSDDGNAQLARNAFIIEELLKKSIL